MEMCYNFQELGDITETKKSLSDELRKLKE